jgi:hypothetical protein
MSLRNYVLDEHGNPKEEPDLLKWAAWYESNKARRVALDERGDVMVSTVFLGLDHRFGEGAPILYETMIFGGKENGYQDRYCTREEALEGHKKALAMAGLDK